MTVVDRHCPEQGIEQRPEARSDPAEGSPRARVALPGVADEKVPGVVWVDADELASCGSDIVDAVAATVLNPASNVQRVSEHTHAQGDLVQVASTRAPLHHLGPLVRRTTGSSCLPYLVPGRGIEGPGVEVLV